jgi:hypothetical protein
MPAFAGMTQDELIRPSLIVNWIAVRQRWLTDTEYPATSKRGTPENSTS